MGRAYCNLGLAHLALGNLETALECQKYFLAIAHMTQHSQGKFRALGNIGDVLIKMGDVEEAVKMYQRQLGFARHVSIELYRYKINFKTPKTWDTHKYMRKLYKTRGFLFFIFQFVIFVLGNNKINNVYFRPEIVL